MAEEKRKIDIVPVVAIGALLLWVFVAMPMLKGKPPAPSANNPPGDEAPADPAADAPPNEAPPAEAAPAPEAADPPAAAEGEDDPPAAAEGDDPPPPPPPPPAEGGDDPPPAEGDAPKEETPPEVIPDVQVLTDAFDVTMSCVGATVTRLAFRSKADGGFSYSNSTEEATQEGLVILDEIERGMRSFALFGLTESNYFEKAIWKLVSKKVVASPDGGKVTVVTWRATASGLEVTKVYAIPSKGFLFNIVVTVKNTSVGPRAKLAYALRGAAGIVPDDSGSKYLQMTAVVAAREGAEREIKQQQFTANSAAKIRRKAVEKGDSALEGQLEGLRLSRESVEWAAMKNRYFAVILQADGKGISRTAYSHPLKIEENSEDIVPGRDLARYNQPNALVGLKSVPVSTLAPEADFTHNYRVYAGPLDEDRLKTAGPDSGWTGLISYGWSWFNWLSRLLRRLLLGIYWVARNFGVAIILLTIVVKSVMHPLTRKSMVSAHKVQKIQPLVKALQKKYEGDKSPEAQRKMMREQQDLFREHGVSPAGGCLPMLFQMPMLIALFGCFRGAFELRQQGFLWIHDLSRPDTLTTIGFSLPLIGNTINLLPFLYVALMIFQQKLAPKSQDPQMRQQQQMMMIMPLVFFFIFYSMPSGLVLYFVASSIFTLVEQWHIRRGLALAEAGEAEEGSPTTDPAAGLQKQPKRKKKKRRRK